MRKGSGKLRWARLIIATQGLINNSMLFQQLSPAAGIKPHRCFHFSLVKVRANLGQFVVYVRCGVGVGGLMWVERIRQMSGIIVGGGF